MNADNTHICPRCRRGWGRMYRVIPDEPNSSNSSRVLLRCDGCHHRWSIIVPTESLPPDSDARLSRRAVWPAPS